jgi:hypothetical protein
MSVRVLLGAAAASAAAAVGYAVWFSEPRRSVPTPGANGESAPTRRSRLLAALEQRSVHAPCAVCDHTQISAGKIRRPETCSDPWGKLGISSHTCPVDNQKDMARRFLHLGAHSRSSRLSVAGVCPACGLTCLYPPCSSAGA